MARSGFQVGVLSLSTKKAVTFRAELLTALLRPHGDQPLDRYSERAEADRPDIASAEIRAWIEQALMPTLQCDQYPSS